MAISFTVATIAFGVIATLDTRAEANAFLGRGPPTIAMAPLLDELESILGQSHRSSTESRAAQIEEALLPTFKAMPKSPDGGIRPDAVRYMVHRYFVDRHGWFVDGLGSSASRETANSSSPATIFKDTSSEDVQEVFEVRFNKHSFTLHQVAVFAATIEGFVHNETLERLDSAYRVLGFSEKNADPKTVTTVIESYMILYVLGANYSKVTPRIMRNMRARITEIYPTWKATKNFIADVHAEMLSNRNAEETPPTLYNFSAQVLEEISDRYGRWQNHECIDLKNSLVKLEEPGTGRVRLEAFYESALQGNWQFSETIGYLRQLGSLDEADPDRPSVVISNYINSPSNCVASSKFYSVCCIDECEALVSHVETHIGAPEASPNRIVELVSALPSPTVQAPRFLSASLIQRLDEIARHHQGTVPFHGRLFAQWMHHAYPLECSYPHMSGTLNPLTPLQWQNKTGENPALDKEQMRLHVDNAKKSRKSEQEDLEVPWTSEEELFVCRSAPDKQESGQTVLSVAKSLAKHLVGLAAIFSVTLTIVRMFVSAKRSVVSTPNEKYFV